MHVSRMRLSSPDPMQTDKQETATPLSRSSVGTGFIRGLKAASTSSRALRRLAGKDAVGNAQRNLFDGPAGHITNTQSVSAIVQHAAAPGLESVPFADASSSCSIS